jgi:hypothetical protein
MPLIRFSCLANSMMCEANCALRLAAIKQTQSGAASGKPMLSFCCLQLHQDKSR